MQCAREVWTYLPSKRPSIANGTEIKGVAAAICGRAIVLREGGGGEEGGGQEQFHKNISAKSHRRLHERERFPMTEIQSQNRSSFLRT